MEETFRINKYLSKCGYCSRREADRLLEKGAVLVNGEQPVLGQCVTARDVVTVHGTVVSLEEKEVIIAYHKPLGVVCSCREDLEDSIIHQIDIPQRIYPVGRLDKDSTGLILLTNNGELMNQILKGKNMHEKEYVVEVNKPATKEIFDAMEQGVPILEQMTRPCKVTNRQGKRFHIILTQGLNRQIRRMCNNFGLRVRTLKRIRIMNIELGNLPVGKWRELTVEETVKLKKMCGLEIEHE